MMIERELCARILEENNRILLLCHRHPDGDTLGSAAALAHALKAAGKTVAVCCDDEIPSCYDFMLEGLARQADFVPELVAAIDVADTVLLGKNSEAAYAEKIGLCIDHHGSNKLYAEKVWLCEASASTAEMVYSLLCCMKAPITAQMASCLFTGVSTDTGCFRFSNTTADTHRVAAKLIELGADTHSIIQTFFETKTKTYAAIERLALEGMGMYLDGRCAIMPVTQEMFKKSGAHESDTDRLANLPRQIEGVLVGVTLRELENGDFKASVRTHGEIDAAEICKRLGGGGHRGAAGCTLSLPQNEAVKALLAEISSEIDKYTEAEVI